MALLDDLQAILGPDRASATPGHREQHSRGASSHAPVLPDVVVWPQTTAEVSAIARYANERRIPLVGWGAGTSIEGNPIPTRAVSSLTSPGWTAFWPSTRPTFR